MKPERIYLSDLTDKTKSFKVKVKVIDKSRPMTSPTKGTRYQRLVLKDDKGNTMRAALFGKEIDGFKKILQLNGEYEIVDAPIRAVDPRYQTNPNEFQMGFSDKTIIQPLDDTPAIVSPCFRTIASIPRGAALDDRFDILGVVIFIEETRKVKTLHDQEREVREIVVVDQSTEQPMIISAWNDLTTTACNDLNSWAGSFLIIGLTALKATKHKGFSLATTMSTIIIHAPDGEKADALRAWANKNKTLLKARMAKVLQVRCPSLEKNIATIAEVEKKENTNTMQEERHWIKVVIPDPEQKDLHIYLGCSNCARKTDIEEAVKFTCSWCNRKDVTSVPNMTFKFNASDDTGTLNFTAFNKDCETLFATTAAELYQLNKDEKEKTFYNISKRLQEQHFYMQIGPATTLSRTNYLQWILKSVSLE